MEENKKSAFISKVEEFATSMSEMTSENKTKRGLVILATETPEDSNTTAQEIAIMGNQGQIVRAIAELATQEQTRELVVEGLKLASIKTLMDKLGGDLTTINLTIKS
ncbi:hypothetical protein IMSAGC004_03524 [Bacteroidaceae bacterium]|uniref:hypothetical protein n=1 Tax=Bacteroidales TaxID=171549 RepID=UPI001093981B|nr:MULTISPECIES: hypothetical protein [Bacteroidales]TGY03734.1 hypothetical protein E5354_09590 [Muribaculum sp. NM65_B17]THG42395.1 hypothetical protein E5985_09785 [Muribaculaceae bacterium]GFI01113.1 hypothetical protein IMSAGC004_03524 [Bacteroidaceae bacterium]